MYVVLPTRQKQVGHWLLERFNNQSNQDNQEAHGHDDLTGYLQLVTRTFQ